MSSVFLFNAILLVVALWGAWLGWTRSKSPTARAFTTAAALAWAVGIVWGGWQAYQQLEDFAAGGYAAQAAVPVIGDTERCSLCYQGPAGKVYVVAGARIQNGEFHLTDERGPVRYSVRFEEGEVYLNERRLDPGCHEGEAEPYSSFKVKAAKGFRLEVGEAASCE